MIHQTSLEHESGWLAAVSRASTLARGEPWRAAVRSRRKRWARGR